MHLRCRYVTPAGKHRHYSGIWHYSAFCHFWYIPHVPSDFTGTIAGNRHYRGTSTVLENCCMLFLNGCWIRPHSTFFKYRIQDRGYGRGIICRASFLRWLGVTRVSCRRVTPFGGLKPLFRALKPIPILNKSNLSPKQISSGEGVKLSCFFFVFVLPLSNRD